MAIPTYLTTGYTAVLKKSTTCVLCTAKVLHKKQGTRTTLEESSLQRQKGKLQTVTVAFLPAVP